MLCAPYARVSSALCFLPSCAIHTYMRVCVCVCARRLENSADPAVGLYAKIARLTGSSTRQTDFMAIAALRLQLEMSATINGYSYTFIKPPYKLSHLVPVSTHPSPNANYMPTFALSQPSSNCTFTEEERVGMQPAPIMHVPDNSPATPRAAWAITMSEVAAYAPYPHPQAVVPTHGPHSDPDAAASPAQGQHTHATSNGNTVGPNTTGSPVRGAPSTDNNLARAGSGLNTPAETIRGVARLTSYPIEPTPSTSRRGAASLQSHALHLHDTDVDEEMFSPTTALTKETQGTGLDNTTTATSPTTTAGAQDMEAEPVEVEATNAEATIGACTGGVDSTTAASQPATAENVDRWVQAVYTTSQPVAAHVHSSQC